MPMVPATLQADILNIFYAMNSIYQDGDVYQASEMAKAIKKYILTGVVATADVGVAPAGSYTGTGVGTMTIDADVLANDLLATFLTRYTNNDLADHMATDIDNACAEAGTVKTTSNGTAVIPSGGTASFSGPGEGKFAGNKSTIATALKTCFSTMNTMSQGGNEYYAAQFAAAIHSYLTAGTINVILKPLFASGTGVGKIA